MEFRFLPVFATAIILCFAVSHGALPAEMYWRSVLPNTPMPRTLRNLLLPPAGNTKAVLVEMVKKNKDNGGISQAKVYAEKGNTKAVLADMVKKNKDNGGISQAKVYAQWEGNLITNNDVFFLENELHFGKKMNLKELSEKASKAVFLSRSVAEMLPFSTQKFSEILKYFSLDAKSEEASLLKQTIENCERPAIGGEEKYCATSLESFVDSSVSRLGKNVQLLSNELEKETENPEFTIGQGVKMVGNSEIVCHKMNYAYAVFYCHSIDKTVAYTVPLVGADGTRVRSLAVCHKDTSAWSPEHLAFKILKVKPGTIPICHFLARETLVWVPN
ncbi:hypothetical protein DITRI_Ditri07aG0059800 [Diplodiscus trichospermus]